MSYQQECHRQTVAGLREVARRLLDTRLILRFSPSRRPSFLQVAWLMSATLLWLCALANASNANAAAAFVQVSAATPQSNQSQVSVTYASAQAAGDTNILAIGWNDATSNIISVTDSARNTYQVAVPTARGNGLSQAIYYAKNIGAAAARANTVTVIFSAAAPFVDIRATEYSGLDRASPLDVGRSASGTSATPNSGSVTTTAAQELVFGAGVTTGGFSAAGTNFTSRIITVPDADIVEDRFVTATGSYGATAPLSGSAAWIMQVATFKGTAGVDVVTYHYDGQRTGWNSRETALSASNVNSASFGLLSSVAVDDQIDAQPLLVTKQSIQGVAGNRDVVYVATEGNSLYAIDASSGQVLLQRNFGTPVKISLLGDCHDNGGQIGITSTPVIDRAAGRLYVIAYTNDAGVLTYRLHALNLTTLADAIPPVVVSASHTLSDGTTTYTFQASRNRQRPALLEVNGNIYAGFGSFCDFFADLSRGWVLGWNASTFQSLTVNQLNDKLVNSFHGYFLSSVWMSGGGLAASADGSIFFASGNSDPSGTSYDPVNNLAESVVKLSGDLSRVVDYFTPNDVSFLDSNNADFSAGGVLLIPTQSGPVPDLAVHLGKIGPLYLLNQQNLGKFNPNGGVQCNPREVCAADKVVGNFALDPSDDCWCTPSYFTGSDGVGRVVLSAGHHIIIWKIQTSPTVTLVKERTLPDIASGQDAGFFTSVSSNGTQAGSAVVWAISRPTDQNPANILLYAFNPTNGSLLFSANAGIWPSPGNANIVPVVANGRVYVGSYKQLAIFGPKAAGAAVATAQPALSATAPSETPVRWNQITGRVLRVSGTEVIVQQRWGAHVKIDAKPAQDARQSVLILKGEIITAEGNYDALGVLHAKTIVRAKASPALWPRDQ
jgi:hypothetical protein